MSFEFMTVDSAQAIARTPMEHAAREAGAQFEVRDGWNVAASYGSPNAESLAGVETVGWADVSHLRKLELQGELAAVSDGIELELGRATRAEDAWWCPLTGTRALVICDPDSTPKQLSSPNGSVSVLDVTTVLAAMTLIGPLSREVFARFCALDLRPAVMPVGGLRPGSIARQPGLVLREDEDRFVLLFGWAVGHYMWAQVADAATHLGGRPVGLDALAALRASVPEVGSHA